MWTPDIDAEGGPKYLAIAAVLSRDIASGALQAGDRLPPQRALAERLGIDLTTVTKAYNEVRRAGLIEGGGRRGSFVLGAVAAVAAVPEVLPLDTGMNLPPEPVGGTLAERYRKGVADLLASPGAAARLHYQPSGGGLIDRAAGAALLRSRGIDAPDDAVMIAGGGQNALHAIVSATLSAGDVVCTGHHIYPGFLAIARRYGLRIEAVASDGEGLLPDALDAACRARAVKAVYVVPTNDNPTTATMGAERRRAIADCAERHGIAIIEDDAYGLLPVDPLPPLAVFAPERTWHILSLSKIISPGLRVAYLRAPSIKLALRIAPDIYETIIMAPPLNAALATKWLSDGSFAALVAEVRGEAEFRQGLVAGIIETEYAAHHQGYHLWLPLSSAVSTVEIMNALRPQGLSVMPSESFAVDGRGDMPALRVSIGGGLTRGQLERTLYILGAMLEVRDGRQGVMV